MEERRRKKKATFHENGNYYCRNEVSRYGAGQEPDHILGGLSQLKNLMKYYSMIYSGPGLDLGQTGLVYLNPTYLEP